MPNQTAEVIVLFENAMPGKDKLAELEAAMSDPLFLADIEEISEDFQYLADDVAGLLDQFNIPNANIGNPLFLT